MNESIIEKIRALLRLAKSDNAHEAALAMQRAMEIATKHQLDLADISPDDEIHKLIGRYMPTPSRLAHEWKEALNIAHGFFNVNITTIQRDSRCLIVGSALDIELAEYVITYLVRVSRQSLAAWKDVEAKARRKTSGPKVAAFIEGFFLGLRVKLMQQQTKVSQEHSGYAIALVDARQQRAEFTKVELGEVTAITMPEVRKDRRSMNAGYKLGREAEINPALRGNNSTLALPPN